MKITLSVTKGTKEDTFTMKVGTSIGGGQEKYKDIKPEELGKAVAETVRKADEMGFVGKK